MINKYIGNCIGVENWSRYRYCIELSISLPIITKCTFDKKNLLTKKGVESAKYSQSNCYNSYLLFILSCSNRKITAFYYYIVVPNFGFENLSSTSISYSLLID